MSILYIHTICMRMTGKMSATTEYGVSIDAAVQRGNLCAVQFHPEKSGEIGLQMLRILRQCSKGGRRMYAKRIIPCLDVNNGRVVKGPVLSICGMPGIR